jgi:hypothetical protein
MPRTASIHKLAVSYETAAEPPLWFPHRVSAMAGRAKLGARSGLRASAPPRIPLELVTQAWAPGQATAGIRIPAHSQARKRRNLLLHRNGVGVNVRRNNGSQQATTKGNGGMGRTPDSSVIRPASGRIFDIPLHPVMPDFTSNLFDRSKAGHGVVRSDDLLALRVELQNLEVLPGSPPRLRKAAAGPAHLILHFPPQAITEESFFEAQSPYKNPPRSDGSADPYPPPPTSDVVKPPPVQARIAHESRLSFAVGDGFDIPYTLSGVLEACQNLALAVPAHARPPSAVPAVASRVGSLVAGRLEHLTARQRQALASFALRSLQIARQDGGADLLRLRQIGGGAGLRAVADLAAVDKFIPVPLPTGPQPVAPGAMETAIEIPWRLILSPHHGERWRHADMPVTSPATQRTELWHSRLTMPDPENNALEVFGPDPQRTLRAVWALTGEGSPRPMQSAFPGSADLPAPNASPFQAPLTDFDRFQITHLSSNFSRLGYAPQPVGANLVMLSSLGGWLDCRGAWDPPGLWVEEWTHRASMGRDHQVRVVYKGFLFPFGHRVSLVKLTERKFHHASNESGNPAYLRQRIYILVREPERRFTDMDLLPEAKLHRQLPFSRVRILNTTTPDLDPPDSGESRIDAMGQLMFWPCVHNKPFRFQCAATDLDNRRIQFDLPMIFMDNTVASPMKRSGLTLQPDFPLAEQHAARARDAWHSRPEAGRQAPANQQRLALAPSVRAGDTTVQAVSLLFDAEIGPGQFRAYSQNLQRPVFYPKLSGAEVRIAALAQLANSPGTTRLRWNEHYLVNGFSNNPGEVFAEVEAGSTAQLDFSGQGDRSGGFVQPNLAPSALSRLAGPVMGPVSDFVLGRTPPGGGFPTTLSDLPLPLLFGCIPLGEVIQAVTDIAASPEKIPKFASEAGTQLETFVNGLVRLAEFVRNLADQPGRIADAALAMARATLQDQLEQARAYAEAQVADLRAAIEAEVAALQDVAAKLQVILDQPIDAAPLPADLPAAIIAARNGLAGVRAAANASPGGMALPAGLRQSVLLAAGQLDVFLADLQVLMTLLPQAKDTYAALDAIIGDAGGIDALFSDPDQLAARVTTLAATLDPLKATVATFRLLDGAPRATVLNALSAVQQVLGGAVNLVEMLTGEELTIRFDWNPEIGDWGLTPGAPLFRANDRRGFVVAVEAKVRKSGTGAPRISVACSLKHFDLILVAPASFLELNFEKIAFTVGSAAKMDVDVLLSDIKFVGPLSFVETLRDLIPLDGFSDPPFLDISPKGIDAGFAMNLPNIAVGLFSLSNISLGAGFTVPFIGQPLSVRFNFCTREQPFNLTVALFGGGGFFAVTVDPSGVQVLEAAFEFGASISVNLGVASGGVHVMAGLYFRIEQDAATLTGYFRLGGYVSVLGLISASIELYLELRYESESCKCVGRAELTIEISVFMFSKSVTISCERKFAGANGDPSFRDLMGLNPALPLPDELALIDGDTAYAWREYCEAFA